MKIWQSVLQSTQGRLVLAGLLLLAAWQTYLSLSAPRKSGRQFATGRAQSECHGCFAFHARQVPRDGHAAIWQSFGYRRDIHRGSWGQARGFISPCSTILGKKHRSIKRRLKCY
jgi:hypothetical protein